MSISVIIPVYNAEKYLPQCLAALDAQTAPDVRPVLVDDGSSDGSAALCEAYAARYPGALFLRKENGGAASARNAGLARADGDYVAFWDADDLAAPWMLERLLALSEAENADIVQCALLSVPPDATAAAFAREGATTLATGAEAIGWLYGARYMQTVPLWNKLYRRAVWDGLRIPEGHICEDEAVIAELLFRAARVAHIDAPMYAYRQSENSVMRLRGSLKRLDLLWALERRSDFLAQKGLREWQTLNDRQLTLQYVHYYNYLRRECERTDETRAKERELLRRFRERARADREAGPRRRLLYAAYALCPACERLLSGERR